MGRTAIRSHPDVTIILDRMESFASGRVLARQGQKRQYDHTPSS
jgi:hypothetical protein